MQERDAKRRRGALYAVLLILIACPWLARAQFTINGAQKNQMMDGIGTVLNHRGWNGDEIKPVLNAMINQGGFRLFGVTFECTDWMTTSNESPAFYNSVYGSARFEKLWDIMAYLNQQGITNGITLNFEGPGPQWMGGASLTPGYEPQWAQMISSAVTYARNTRHLQFDFVAPDNEPDGVFSGMDVTPTQYNTMLTLLIQDLNSNGITDIRFVQPNLAYASDVTNWMQEMMSSPLIMSNLAHFGLHSYSDDGQGSSGVSNFIASSAYPNSTFWMTECNVGCMPCFESIYDTNTYDWSFCSGTAQYILYHLANGASGAEAYDGFDSYYECLPVASLPSGQYAAAWSFYGLFGVDDTNAVPKTYTPRKNFYTVAQIAAFVPPGAQCIGVNGGSDSSFMMLAFYHAASGRVTLTGFNTSSQTSPSITLTNLPAVASFALYYTDPSNNLNQSATFPVVNGSFTATIPANCIWTLTGFDPAKIAVSVQITNPSNGTQYGAPANVSLAAAASTTTGSITNVEYFSGTNEIGASASAPYNISWTNVAPGTYPVTALATDSAGHTNLSPAVMLTVAGAAAQVLVSLTNTAAIMPTNATVVPYGQLNFAATVVDALGTPLSPQPAVTWYVSGRGIINNEGVFTAGGSVGGPYIVTALSGNLSGSMEVNIATNVNLALNGIAYTWYNLTSSVENTPQSESPQINDGITTTNVSLLPWLDGSADIANAYEGAGVIWSIPQTISNVVFINGSTSGGDGTFDANFQLQFTRDGSTWTPADSQWSGSPGYDYNSASGSPVSYVFSGSLATVLGVRCIGMVNTGHDSTFAYATEVQASSGAPPLLQASPGAGGIVVSWLGSVTNCTLQMATNLVSPSWTTITNPRQNNNGQISVMVSAAGQQQYFRLFFP